MEKWGLSFVNLSNLLPHKKYPLKKANKPELFEGIVIWEYSSQKINRKWFELVFNGPKGSD